MSNKVNPTEFVKEVVTNLFDLMGVTSKFEVSDGPEESVEINIDAIEEAGLLIGKRGDTVMSLQTIVSLIIKNKFGDWKRVVVNVGDWREKQEEYLKELALQAAERARSTGEPQNLYNLSPNQRRVVHTALAEEKDLITESQGEGYERYLVVKKSDK